MSKEMHIGELWLGGDNLEEIIKVGSKYYCVDYNTKEKREIDKKEIQYDMTNPWSSDALAVYCEKDDDKEGYIAVYKSIVYDFIDISLTATGKTHHEAMFNLSKIINIIFKDYNEYDVEKYISEVYS